jgi:hypothetical protein
MPKTGSDGAKDVFFSHENILRKEYPSHHSNPNLSAGFKTSIPRNPYPKFVYVIRKEIDKRSKHIKNFH